jgi:CubicO group peptidase (beta-lactamase class C family)
MRIFSQEKVSAVKKLLKALLCILILAKLNFPSLADPLPHITAESAGYDSEKLSQITDRLDVLYEDGRIPSYVAAVAKEGQVFFSTARGGASVGSNDEVSLETMYYLASMTKPFVSTAIFQLIEEGKLSLDSELKEFFPIFSDMFVAPNGSYDSQFEEAVRPVTILDLITHTSGFTYGESVIGFGDVAKLYDELGIINGCISRDENMELLSQIPLVAQPGATFNYSVGVDILGAVLEVVTNQRLGDYISQNITGPLGMTNTSFVLSEEDEFASIYVPPSAGNRPIGRIDGSDIDWKIAPLESGDCAQGSPDRLFDSGGGGIFGSAYDYLKFLSMVANRGKFQETTILQPSSVEQQLSNLVPGLGLEAFEAQFGEAAAYMSFGGGYGIKQEPDDDNKIDYFFWGGAANTAFWFDPADNSVGVFFTAFLPGQYNISDDLEQIVDDARL